MRVRKREFIENWTQVEKHTKFPNEFYHIEEYYWNEKEKSCLWKKKCDAGRTNLRIFFTSCDDDSFFYCKAGINNYKFNFLEFPFDKHEIINLKLARLPLSFSEENI